VVVNILVDNYCIVVYSSCNIRLNLIGFQGRVVGYVGHNFSFREMVIYITYFI
jgi:hypothetical protein